MKAVIVKPPNKTLAMIMAPYMKREPTLTVTTLEKATVDVKDTMKIFNELRESRNLGDDHFEEIINSYHNLMEDAVTSKDKKNVHLMKKATASLELLSEELKKSIKDFDRRYKKLIAEAKDQKKTGETGEESDGEDEDGAGNGEPEETGQGDEQEAEAE